MSRCSIARLSWAVLCVYSALGTSARADDLFEIDVFHARVDEPGQFGLELHSNYVVSGVPVRDPPELPPRHVLYEMLEPSYGFSRNLEVGMHLQTAIRPDGTVDPAGVKLRVMGVVPTTSILKLAVNIEGGYIPRTYDPRTTVLEIRPVAELKLGALDADINPIVSIGTRGRHPGVPSFEPAAAVRYRVLGTLDVGLEYYAGIGQVLGTLPASQQTHYVFETLDLVRRFWNVHVGLGEGLTAASDGLIVTTLVSHYF